MARQDAGPLTFEDALDVLTHPYRRRLLMTILDHNPEDVAAIPEDVTANDEDLRRMLLKLTHVHLPKLESLGIIEWDRDAAVVRKGPQFETLRPLLELLDRHQDELPDGWL